jgi:hypothetical protein
MIVGRKSKSGFGGFLCRRELPRHPQDPERKHLWPLIGLRRVVYESGEKEITLRISGRTDKPAAAFTRKICNITGEEVDEE